MLVTLIPLFDDQMAVRAYSLFTQKKNLLLNPILLGTGCNDGAVNIDGLDIIHNMGIETLCGNREIFIALNNISIFTDIEAQYEGPIDRIVLLIDHTITPEPMYINRLKTLKIIGYKIAMRRLKVSNFEQYKEILQLTDYMLLDHKKIDISKAKIYFSKIYPNIKLCAVNIENMDIYEELKNQGGYELYEGEFYRVPVTKGKNEIAPLKVNYIQLLNIVNDENFDLTQAADVIGRDTALIVSLLKIVNRISINSEITSIRHAAAMMGQKELKKWINTAVTHNLCMDKPNEVTRLSLLRAKFAENLSEIFGLKSKSSELFLMGLFSVLDLILDKPMVEALQLVKVSNEINEALIDNTGNLAPVLEFMSQYEKANWQEVSRSMILKNIEMDKVYEAYVSSLTWYRELIAE